MMDNSDKKVTNFDQKYLKTLQKHNDKEFLPLLLK
jgi:hypothetical protein